METKVARLNTSYQLRIPQLELNAKTAKEAMNTLRAKYKMGEARVKALVTKHRQKLNLKVEEALARGRKDWSTQAPKLQGFRADTENRKKEGCGFYKMDENSIQML